MPDAAIARLLTFAALVASAVGWAQPPLGVTADPGATTVRVWAPHARSVAVIGDFNNWKPMQGDQLTKDDATGVWSLTLRRSRPRGAYAFLINGNLRRRDPYARAGTPDGKHSLFYDASSFKWAGERNPGPDLADTVIYEMHIGAFHDPTPRDGMPGTFDDAIRRLDYLVELGVNTLCLLPVHEFNGHHSWGYNPCDLFAVEQSYGGPDGLKRFVQAAHARGLAVHLDIVHNHYGPENLDLLQFDGTGNPRNGGIYFYEGEGIGMTPWGPRVKFDEPMVRRFIRDNAMMWLEEYRVDGFRWDSTINIRAHNFGAHPIPAGASMLDAINDEIRQRFPGRWSIAEDSLDIGRFHASWDYDFHHQVMPVLSAPSDDQRDMRMLARALERTGGMPRVVYVDNHDEAGKINGQMRIASDIDPADPGSDRARRLSALGAVLTFTAPGIPLLFMGNEFQEYGTFHDDIPLDWTKTRKHAGMLALHRDLIALRRNRQGDTPGLTGWNIQIPRVDPGAKQLVYWRSRENAPDDIVVVAIHLRGEPDERVIPFPSAGPWTLRLNTDSAAYGGGARQDAAKPFTLDARSPLAKTVMAPYSARIFSLAQRPHPPRQSPAADTSKPAAPATPKMLFSMYASIHLVGSFNDWDKTSWPFTQVADYQWEGPFVFHNVENPAFRISANDDGVIFWGGFAGEAPIAENTREPLKRLGSNFVSNAVWDGHYRFHFDEDKQTLLIQRLGDVPDQPPDAAANPFRIWTDVRGTTVEAMLVEADDTTVTLERRDGKRSALPRDRLSAEDRDYLEQTRPIPLPRM